MLTNATGQPVTQPSNLTMAYTGPQHPPVTPPPVHPPVTPPPVHPPTGGGYPPVTPPPVTPPPVTPPPHNPNAPNCVDKKVVWVSREVDGKNNTGIVGVGIDNVSEINRLMLMPQFKADAIHDINADLIQTDAMLTGATRESVLGKNDMFIAGDPFFGGSTNGFNPTKITAPPGLYTMFKDGHIAEGGRGMVTNGRLEVINPEGDQAFTEYGLVFSDDAGATTKAVIGGGRILVGKPDGSHEVILPPNGSHVVGDPADPTARIFFATRQGDGEPRLHVEYYEKPTPEAVAKMVQEGIPQAEALQVRRAMTQTYGWRIPDGLAESNRAPLGYSTGDYWPVAVGGAKTYYDTHWVEQDRMLAEICVKPGTTTPSNNPIAANETGRLWGDPHIKGGDTAGDWSYTIDEVGLFNVLKDTNVDVRTEFVKAADGSTRTNQAAFTLGTDTLLAARGGQFFLNGQPLPAKGEIPLSNGGKLYKDGDYLGIQTGNNIEYNFELVANAQDIDIHSYTKAVGVGNGFLPYGLIGETFDADSTPVTAPKRPVNDYRVSSLFNDTWLPTHSGPLQLGQNNVGNTTGGPVQGNTGSTGNTGNAGGGTTLSPEEQLKRTLATFIQTNNVDGLFSLIMQLLQAR